MTKIDAEKRVHNCLFCTNLEPKIWSVFCSCYLVEVTKLNLGRDSEAGFGQDFEVQVLWICRYLVEILNLMLGGDSDC